VPPQIIEFSFLLIAANTEASCTRLQMQTAQQCMCGHVRGASIAEASTPAANNSIFITIYYADIGALGSEAS
jgi:hypothetical protein